MVRRVKAKTVLAWHFTNKEHTLGYGDGRKVIASKKLTVGKSVVMCLRGLHASVRLLDAFSYSNGNRLHLWRVRLSGEIKQGQYKHVASERTALWCIPKPQSILDKFYNHYYRTALKLVWNEKTMGKMPLPLVKWMEGGRLGKRVRAAVDPLRREHPGLSIFDGLAYDFDSYIGGVIDDVSKIRWKTWTAKNPNATLSAAVKKELFQKEQDRCDAMLNTMMFTEHWKHSKK